MSVRTFFFKLLQHRFSFLSSCASLRAQLFPLRQDPVKAECSFSPLVRSNNYVLFGRIAGLMPTSVSSSHLKDSVYSSMQMDLNDVTTQNSCSFLSLHATALNANYSSSRRFNPAADMIPEFFCDVS